MKRLQIIVCMFLLTCSFKVTSQQNTISQLISIPQIGNDMSFLALNDNIHPLKGFGSFDKYQGLSNYLSVSQVGINNIVEVKNGTEDQQLINQRGKDNYYSFIDYYNNSPTKMNVFQQGNANALHIYGTNSLMENIKITQKSNYKTILIRNY